ncbi:MAG: GspE/PulE family protein [Candidatus Zipacnadales bacterium]
MRASGRRLMIGQILVQKGLITEEKLNEALETQKQTTQRIGEILVDLGYVDQRQLYEALAEQQGIPFVDLTRYSIDPAIAQLLDRPTAERHKAIPLARGDGTIQVAMAEPDNVIALDDLKMRLQVPVEPLLAVGEAIEQAIPRVYESAPSGVTRSAEAPTRHTGRGEFSGVDITKLTESIRDSRSLATEEDLTAESEQRIDTDRISDMTEEAPIIKITKVIIQRAIQERASDIHVEPMRKGVRVRYRIDGVLHEVLPLPRYVHAPLISRLKIMSEMNIAERRVPQDGRIHIRHGDKDYDLRVSAIPTTLGEKIVMRILDKSSVLLGLDSLGLTPETQAELEKLIVQPNGMLISCGPTGSGKTTTQYSVLNKINSVEKNIITIEDPVEYQLAGLSQVHVNRKAGLTFAVALKYFLRQDPDIIMVGEIRDLETSEIAIQAALTGHLVLSTLHTNDAPSTTTRLVDMGVEPFLISASVIGALGQRLARRVCENCKEPYEPRRDLLLTFGFDPDLPENRDQVFYHGVGCEACRHTGYRGRIGIFELMVMTPEIQEMVVRRASHQDIKETAVAQGMVTLQQDAFNKVLAGITDVEEITRVVFTAGQVI